MNFAERTPQLKAQQVARNAEGTMAVGLVEPEIASKPIAVVGTSWIEAVLIARKVHIALVATPGRGFNFSRSAMARRPSGVAAFPRPSMLAAIFITMDPIAGWSGGTSGKRRRITGRNTRAMN